VQVRTLRQSDVDDFVAAVTAARQQDESVARRLGDPVELFGRYLAEQAAGDRVVVVAEADGRPVGYLGVVWRSDYQPFRDSGIPEIVDLNVLPRHRRQGLGTALLDAAEATVASRTPVAGIACGVSATYAPAMLLCLKRGYLPDGRGIAYDGRTVPPGGTVPLDDATTLMFVRRLH
jgi:GNAT superfamily N-acetyltransferase